LSIGGTPDEVGNVGALIMEPDGALIRSANFLMGGGGIVTYWYGEVAASNCLS
jgi:hypothetical protein